MYDHHIDEMLTALKKAGIVKTPSACRKAKAALEGVWKDRIAIIWSVEDVMHQAKIDGMFVSEDDARDVLSTVLRRHDCNVGITWTTLSIYLDDYRGNNG